MAFDQQLIVRIKSFLSSSDLTDSATARELYNAYLAADGVAAKRVLECGELIRKQQKIEAVLAARRPPELFDMLDMLICPERKQLDELADLYNWPRLTPLDMATIDELHEEVRAMDDLRPLLTEFRRIARTDRLEEKLHLLREIYRLDRNNPEWHDALSEVENQYLFRLIAEAKQAIEGKDEERLIAIHDELKNTNWLVAVPTIVMQKIDKIVAEIRKRKLREQAEELLVRIRRVVREADTVALEDALLCWEKHCRGTGYRPDPAEDRQIAEAADFLKNEKRKLEEEQIFQRRIEETGALIDRRAPLEDVEKCYAAAEAMKREMPQFITKRMKRYRNDVMRSRRISGMLKGVRIVVCAVILLVIAAGAALLTLQLVTEKKLTAELDKTIGAGDLTKAESMIADLEKNQPKLAKSDRIVRAKAEIAKRREEEKNRGAALNVVIDELNAMLSEPTFKFSVFDSKVAYARELARNDEERGRIDACARHGRRVFEEQQKKSEMLFTAQIRKLQTLRAEAKQLIARSRESGYFDIADAKLREIERLANEARNISPISPNLLADNEDVLNSGAALEKELDGAKERYRQVKQCLADIADSSSITALEVALDTLKKLLATYGDLPEELSRLHETLTRDVTAFKAIAKYQSQWAMEDVDNPDSGYFVDAKRLLAYQGAQSEAKQKLYSAFARLEEKYVVSKYPADRRLFLIRFVTDGKILDLYVTPKFNSPDRSCTLTRSDSAAVIITPRGESLYKVTIERKVSRGSEVATEQEEYFNCVLKRPNSVKTAEAIRKSVAPHQQIIPRLRNDFFKANDEEILQTGIDSIKTILDDPLCSPYWKMNLSVRILEALIPLDKSPDRELKKLVDRFRELGDCGDPNVAMHDRKLLEKIDSFLARSDIPAKLDRVAKINALIQERLRLAVKQKFIYLGVFLPGKNAQGDISIRVRLKPGRDGDVWCFDKDCYGCRIVGMYSAQKISFDKDQDRKIAAGRLLFTTDNAVNMAQKTREFLSDQTADELKSVAWPEFWPSNLRKE